MELARCCIHKLSKRSYEYCSLLFLVLVLDEDNVVTLESKIMTTYARISHMTHISALLKKLHRISNLIRIFDISL